MHITLASLVEKLNDEKISLSVKGNGTRIITRVSPPDNADKESLCVIWDKHVIDTLSPDVPIVSYSKVLKDSDRDGIICDSPRALLPKLLDILDPRKRPTGIAPDACVHESAKISPDSYIAPLAFIGENCVVESGSVIEPNAVLLANVKIGKNCLIHSGAVIGCDGFGFVRENGIVVKIPQTGGVTIHDDVEIGACTTIDRGTLTDTVIDSGTKIDNHVQIGHNVQIGKNCIICSMTGVAGSSIIEDNVTISVQAGITDHVRIGEGVLIAGRTGVTNDIPAGSVVSGFPARNHNQAKRALVLAADLPLYVKKLKLLEKKLEQLGQNQEQKHEA
ncbi:MAG: UDP-3-O-(3-hydroxymyristoyl)glucosamine N-acyltransferase [Synergistaceae bacterium]|nr:UDP-3-O-(3-hydroxymyristoyl)glucosamine N-acyltransferase [Synergistaceae bacterium]MBQ9404764.1 UDP-3-O-(3-hydroxymyristoyl)glucosamine N-acyltransferase [Synergistaceae bacterium]